MQRRTIRAQCHEYPEVTCQLQVGLTGAEYTALAAGVADGRFGAVLSRVYCEALIPLEGAEPLDFRTPESAAAQLTREDIPIDLRVWLREAPLSAVEWSLERLRKNLPSAYEETPS